MQPEILPDHRALVADVLARSNRELWKNLCNGADFDLADLAGWQYQGLALGLPRWVERLSWKVFVKAFARDAAGVHGWNVRMQQGGPQLCLPGAEMRPQRRGADPRTFGHYRVVPMAQWPRKLPSGLAKTGVMLDYGSGANPALDPMRPMRDPLVALQSGDPTCLLGWSYVELGPLRVPTPSYFLLVRWRPVDFVPRHVA